MNSREQIKEVLDRFDFNKARKLIEVSLDGFFEDPNKAEIPTVEELKKDAKDGLQEIIDSNKSELTKGCFEIKRKDNELLLSFSAGLEVVVIQ